MELPPVRTFYERCYLKSCKRITNNQHFTLCLINLLAFHSSTKGFITLIIIQMRNGFLICSVVYDEVNNTIYVRIIFDALSQFT